MNWKNWPWSNTNTPPTPVPLPADEQTEFGRQVVNTMILVPDEFRLAKDLRGMYHSWLGTFRFDDRNMLYHDGGSERYSQGSLDYGKDQRALSPMDSKLITEEMGRMATRAISAPALVEKIDSPPLNVLGTATAIQKQQDAINQTMWQQMQQMQHSAAKQLLIPPEYLRDHAADALRYMVDPRVAVPSPLAKTIDKLVVY